MSGDVQDYKSFQREDEIYKINFASSKREVLLTAICSSITYLRLLFQLEMFH